jgi:hypothetical protein
VVPLILFFSVALVGVLSVFAMFSAARKQLVSWRRQRTQKKARAAQLAETARMKVEHAAVLAKLQPATTPSAPVVRPRPTSPAPAHVPAVGLTQLIATLEQSAPFALQEGTDAAGARTRMAKGSVPMPMVNPTPFVVGPRAAPLGPYSSVGAVNLGRPAGTAPPPIPRRPSPSVPPPIPRQRPQRGR